MSDFLGYAFPVAIFLVLFVVFTAMGRRRERKDGIAQKPIMQAVAPVVALSAAAVLVTVFAMSLDTAAARRGTFLVFVVSVGLICGVIAWRRREDG